MKLKLAAKTERVDHYSLRFVVPHEERRYWIMPTADTDRSMEFTFEKSCQFGESTPKSAAPDNAAWFQGLVVGEDWELRRSTR